MAKAAQKIHSTTQTFTEIVEFLDTVVIFSGGYGCLIIEIQATNFSLLSQEEQLAKIQNYAALLNSLTFPIQVLIRNKREDISSYLKLLEEESLKTKNQELYGYIDRYKSFVAQLIKENTILDKKFYMVISFSFLELGATHALKKEDFAPVAQANLNTKANTLLDQIARLNLKAKVLQKNELIKLFYEHYNPLESDWDILTSSDDIQTPIVKGEIK